MIPSYFHFCFGFADVPDEFLYAHYLAVKSALQVNHAQRVKLYVGQPPAAGKWWEKVKDIALIEQVMPPREIFNRPLRHHAHRTDVFRLRVLLENGGVYLDLDTLCLNPFDLNVSSTVMGEQEGHQSDEPHGLCNAVILSPPGSQFLRAWYSEYQWFRSSGRDAYWDEHPVKVPLWLKAVPGLAASISVRPSWEFFYPNFNKTSLLYAPEASETEMMAFSRSRCVHLWESMAMAQVRAITPEAVLASSSAYCQLAREFVGDDRT